MSEAERNQKILDVEKSKILPDNDKIYYLEQTRPYWNIIDTEKMRRGRESLESASRLERVLKESMREEQS